MNDGRGAGSETGSASMDNVFEFIVTRLHVELELPCLALGELFGGTHWLHNVQPRGQKEDE